MSAHSTALQIAAKVGMLLGAFLVFTILLAALPAHRTPAQQASAQESATQTPDANHGSMPGMDMSDEHANEKAAVHDMTPGHHDAHSQHMTMTEMHERTAEDVQRASEIVAQLRAGIEKYRDYRVALNDGFKIFLPNIPQLEYHFTSYRNGSLRLLRSIRGGRRRCCIGRLQRGTNWWARCIPCRSARARTNSMRVCR